MPSFEIKDNVVVPRNKEELLRDVRRSAARPFYSELCSKCQKPTDYARWEELDKGADNEIRIAYTVTWKDPWEPFYIAAASLPLYDERFKQYGFNRISQVCFVYIQQNLYLVLLMCNVLSRSF